MAANVTYDDVDSIVDISEQTTRPRDVALQQQRIPAWHPVLDPVWVVFALLYLGVILVPTGLKVISLQRNVVELKVTYDDYNAEEPLICGINTTFNANKTCELELTATDDMSPPILVYYELTNFHQNHRNYFESRDQYQLAGQSQTSTSAKQCEPLAKLGDITLNPCGLIANTFFNDYFTLLDGDDANGDPLEMEESGIAWLSDIEYVFAQPEAFRSEMCPENNCNATCCESDEENEWSCEKPWRDPETGTCYRYFYPDENTTQYLYETYPDIISPLDGVTNEHFIVWMRIATQPTFQKLYGWFDKPIAAGETLRFRVNANFPVEPFRGSKSLIVTTNNIFGGKNPYFGPVLLWVGVFCLAAASFFALKHYFRPRKLADPSYLHYKED